MAGAAYFCKLIRFEIPNFFATIRNKKEGIAFIEYLFEAFDENCKMKRNETNVYHVDNNRVGYNGEDNICCQKNSEKEIQ